MQKVKEIFPDRGARSMSRCACAAALSVYDDETIQKCPTGAMALMMTSEADITWMRAVVFLVQLPHKATASRHEPREKDAFH